MTKTLYLSNACKKLAQKKQTLQPFLWTLFSLILLVGSASTVLYYIFAVAINEFHSDCTDTLYWAEAAMQGNSIDAFRWKPLYANLDSAIWYFHENTSVRYGDFLRYVLCIPLSDAARDAF